MPSDQVIELYGLEGYVFDKRTGRFHRLNPPYPMVSKAKIMGLVQERIEYHRAEMRRLTEALTQGRITLAQWERAFAIQLKDLFLQQAALAKGGWQNMTNADFGRVGRLLREQYKFLHGFAKDIEAGKRLNAKGQPPTTSAYILARAAMYADAGRQSYWTAAQALAKGAGKRFKRRIAKGDKNTCDPCVELAKLGWVPIDDKMPVPGGPPCKGLTACRCEMEYK